MAPSHSPRIDSHCHFWSLKRGDYDWMDVHDPAFAPIARDFSPDDIKPLLQSVNIAQMVLVQAAPSEAETDYLLGLADKNEDIAGVVGWIDLTSPQAALSLEKFGGHPKFKGIRPMLQDIEQTNWLLEKPIADIWEELVKSGLCFDALVQPRHLEMLYQFCVNNPDIPVVIDHVAKPKAGLAGDGAALQKWRDDMSLLANNTHAFCKLSGLVTEMPHGQIERAEQILRPIVETVLELFGPERLMWGSDWPVVTLDLSYQGWDQLTHILLSDLDEAARALIFGDTCRRFYGIGLPQ